MAAGEELGQERVRILSAFPETSMKRGPLSSLQALPLVVTEEELLTFSSFWLIISLFTAARSEVIHP